MLNIVETKKPMLEKMIMREENMTRLIEDKEQEIERLNKRVTLLTTQLEEKKEIISQKTMCQFIYYNY